MTFVDLFKTVLVGIPIGITIVDFFGYVARVDGISMQPCLNPGSECDYVFLSRLSVHKYQVNRGDVVSLFSPKDPEQKLIKRIIGLEGDVINTVSYSKPIVTVPEGHCWIEGDNTHNSMDSNVFGPVALALITAKATAVVWPPSRWHYIQSRLPKAREPVNLKMEK